MRSRVRALQALAGSATLALGFTVASCGPPTPSPNPPGPEPKPIVKDADPAPPATTTAAPAATQPPAPAGPIDLNALSPDDPCYKNKPPPKQYFGVLSQARCDQEMFLTMAGVAGMLGVECKHCHAPGDDPKKEDYPKPTPKKEIANWMNMHLMRALKTADGSPIKCKSCHTDPHTGKPVAKILGSPRDPVKAQEWMSMVMVNKFVTAKGEKLRCKSCHMDNFAQKGFQAKVILRSDQIPAH